MRVLVTGGSGQLARAIQRTWTGHDLIVPAEIELDLASPDAIRQVLAVVRPDVVLNCGAYTAVDKAESEPERARAVNAEAVAVLAEACGDALLVQVSTDYVFDGSSPRPWREEDPTGPLSVYGATKLAGEVAARTAKRHLVARTQWLYEAEGKNFLNTMLTLGRSGKALKVVADQWGAPTTCRRLARQLQAAVEGDWQGTFHLTCGGATSWHGFAAAIFKGAGLTVDLNPCTTADYPTPAHRPAHGVLDNAKRLAQGPDHLGTWEEALKEVLADLQDRSEIHG